MERSAANHAGKLIRVSIKTGTSRERVAGAVERELLALKGTPTRLTATESTKALQDEIWRGIDRIGELTAIEYRTISLDRVRAFVEQEKLDAEASDKLQRLAENQWDRLARSAPTKRGDGHPQKTDWQDRCAQFTKAMMEETTELLSADQRDRLRQELNIRSSVRPVQEQKRNDDGDKGQ